MLKAGYVVSSRNRRTRRGSMKVPKKKAFVPQHLRRVTRPRPGERPMKETTAGPAVEEMPEAEGAVETSDAPPPSFNDLDLAAPLARAVAEMGFETPTPIQARSIPILLAGRDMIGQAQTG